jgi:hypothetical protein
VTADSAINILISYVQEFMCPGISVVTG